MTKINECGVLPLSFLQALAAAIMKDSDGNVFLNVKVITPSNCDCEQVFTCGLQGINIENFVVQNAFELDDCDNVALKIGYCDAP